MDNAKNLQKRKREAEKKIALIDGERMYHLICFGDFVARRENYKEHEGIDALHFYLVQKYRWLPSQVRALNQTDLQFLLAEEMHGWIVPKEDRV